MNKTVTVILAVVLMVIVMAISAVLYFGNVAERTKVELSDLWSADVGGGEVQSLKAINLTGDKNSEVFVQTTDRVVVFDLQGKRLWQADSIYLTTTMGDFNGDGLDEVAVIHGKEQAVQVEMVDGSGNRLWTKPLNGLGQPSRALSVDFNGDKKREMVVGDMTGRLVCLDSAGAVIWSYALPQTAKKEDLYVRGLDDVALGSGRTAVAAANYAGNIALLDSEGGKIWEQLYREPIRRVRVYDLNGDGVSEIVIGGLNGNVSVVGAAKGDTLWTGNVGSRVQEVREARLDADPKTQEVVVGTKDGLVLAFDNKGQQIFSASAGSKVADIGATDLDGDGRDEVIVGTDEGNLAVFGPTGNQMASSSVSGAIYGLDADKLKSGEFLVAAKKVSLRRMEKVQAPWWYNPLLGGFLACLFIAALAWGVTMLKPPPKMEYSAEDMTLEGLRAKRKMLLESRAEARRLHDKGEMPTEAFTARNQQLREQLAATEARMLELGAKFEPEVMKCPNCGGALELGTDRCDYCGQVIV